jgi:FKBP-type peptidyl-prolyl cis-trans isomerase FkpA
MKRVKNLLLILLFTSAIVSSCKKDESAADKQMAIDEQLIKDFIAANNITNAQSDQGVYYSVINPGTGNVVYQSNTVINVKYTGRLLNGQVFDSSSTGVQFPLGRLILGWQIGIPKIQRGGKIRLLVPSGLGYGPTAQQGIPANSVLDFDIELL